MYEYKSSIILSDFITSIYDDYYRREYSLMEYIPDVKDDPEENIKMALELLGKTFAVVEKVVLTAIGELEKAKQKELEKAKKEESKKTKQKTRKK